MLNARAQANLMHTSPACTCAWCQLMSSGCSLSPSLLLPHYAAVALVRQACRERGTTAHMYTHCTPNGHAPAKLAHVHETLTGRSPPPSSALCGLFVRQ